MKKALCSRFRSSGVCRVWEEVYADFHIPLGDCYIEYWGLDTPEYAERQRRKVEVSERYGFRVISLGRWRSRSSTILC